ncbi:MAG TPA: BON domain-containing protein [Polyangia bacterium]|nr:BON domain-containing protein [Polyangia bacterium]
MTTEPVVPPTGKTDLDVRNDVLSELAWDSRIDERQIGVQVDQGVVTLGGTVDDLATSAAAVEAAHRVAGVKDVANELQVKSAQEAHLTDTDLAMAVRHALEWDALIPDKAICSTVTAGVVVLVGIVTTPIQREEVERVVGRLKGVRRLDNRLQVSRVLEPDAVAASIRQALNRRAVREAAHLTLKVAEGHVIVEGMVQSREERTAILGAIRGTRGVQAIDDRLRVEPDERCP